jgi:putative protein-disulfide isomerase
MQSQDNMKLIYVGDPMCSWCYGIAPEWDKIKNDYKDKLEIDYVMGGLRPYYNKPISELKDFLSDHWKHVNEASNQPFTYDILDRSDINYDTEPPSRAVVAVRAIDPHKVGEFFKASQRLFYVENGNMNLSKTYHKILSDLDLDIDKFDSLFDSDAMKDATRSEFDQAKLLGVRSFPTVLLQIGEEHYIVTQGYRTCEQMTQSIEKLIANVR